MKTVFCPTLVHILAGTLVFMGRAGSADQIQFNRDIRPLLAEHCFPCHGPARAPRRPRKNPLRLDQEEAAFAHEGVIARGDPEGSELYLRITARDPEDRMPPPETNHELSVEEIALVRQWIQEGARWEDHWAYLPPRRSGLPAVKRDRWVRNPVDSFILDRLEREGLEPSPEADRRTLIRRLSFDLTGLPPARADVEAFLRDEDPDAYGKVVDRLLSSPHHGERMAMHWLDLVRFADTDGYHGDQTRSISAYRDYVIDAFNQETPFDRFTVEQLAGDLLPDSSVRQKIASGFNMLGMTTVEGGSQAKEFLAKYATDRVRTTAEIWMGATMGCCECHDHKFDPYTSRDFYRFAAFFAGLKEKGVSRPTAKMTLPTPKQAERKRELEATVPGLKKKLEAPAPELEEERTRWARTMTGEIEAKKKVKLPEAIKKILQVTEADRTKKQAEALDLHYRFEVTPTRKDVRARYRELEKELKQLDQAIPTTLVSMAVKPREMRVLPRGNWMDDSGEVVQPGVPQFLKQIETGDRRASRLDLARWLVEEDHPLVARVFMNRLWNLCFGGGICRNLLDLGSQGDWPTHPELLDWLALEFIEQGWNVKSMLKLLVMSSAYRQLSLESELLREIDPGNRLLARQSRYRLDAEMVRDNALFVSGLLTHTPGGPSTRPYQPAGYYKHLRFPNRVYRADKNENQYRRGLYTHWQRQFLHPMLKAFDAPAREVCTAQRPRSNTPLAALVLLNDPTFTEAARVFAQNVLTGGGATTAERLAWAFEEALSRKPLPRELEVLARIQRDQLEIYSGDRESARALIGVGATPVSAKLDPAELASWTAVARVILNLHETIQRY